MSAESLVPIEDPNRAIIGAGTSDVLAPGHTFGSVTDKISSIVLARRTPLGWWLGFLVAFALANVLMVSIAYLVVKGTGIWGIDIPVGWGFAIVNFVWWIGIGHAGTLISAILLLLKQSWRTSINRFAEAMTLFAVACAGIFPIIHTGRPWLAIYWLFPYPNTMGVWPQFRSPLIWDVFAVSTYATVSLLFWFVGLIPDLATLRDRSQSPIGRVIYGALAMGWRGSAMHWHRYETAYLLLAGIATPLVVSVHTVVSFDFAIAIVPGWHTTIFPPYFVAGAIYSGFAMVLTLAIPIRAVYGLEDFITTRHLQNMAKVMLVTGLIVAYGYMTEAFIAWYSADRFERFVPYNRATGPYASVYWSLIMCNVVLPQALWFKRVRMNTHALFVIALIVNIGMWLERYVIVVTSLHRDFLTSAWGNYSATFWDWSTFIGTIGLFLSLLFLFLRFLPMISIAEMRTMLPQAKVAEGQVMATRSPIYGLMAEFDDPNALVAAARRTHEHGYRCVDAYSPFAIEELHDALGAHQTRLPLIVLLGGLAGCLAGYGLQYWVSVIAYPVNVGGKPLDSWPAFIPVTFECTILGAALAAVLGMLALNGLPMPYHPVFNVPRFALASRNRFFLVIEASDEKFELEETRRFLETLNPREVTTVAD